MLSFSHQAQVAQDIVACISVDVVDDLMFGEETLKFALHNQPVLHDVTLRVGERMVGAKHGPIHPVLAVGDSGLETGVRFASDVDALPLPFALRRTELPSPVSGVGDVSPTVGASIRGCLSPPSDLIAAARAIARCLLSSVFRMEERSTGFTGQANRLPFHAFIIPREEKYCEIAVKRLAQEVLL